MDIKHIIESLGYEVQKHGNYFKTKAFWRGGNDINSVTIYPKENRIIDHVVGESYDLKAFLKLILKKNEKELNEWLEEKKLELPKPKLDTSIKNEDFEFNLDYLLPDYTYFLNRGISQNTLNLFLCGLVKKEIMKDRFCFVIQNGKNDVIGIVGRDVTNTKAAKWKICGKKEKFVYPAIINHKLINETKTVYLVEGIADVVALFECGIKNVLCLFGTELQLGVLNYLIKIGAQNIIISTNNDNLLGGSAGNNAAIKIYNKLNKFFDSDCIKIQLPQKCKDWCEILEKYGKNGVLEEIY